MFFFNTSLYMTKMFIFGHIHKFYLFIIIFLLYYYLLLIYYIF